MKLHSLVLTLSLACAAPACSFRRLTADQTADLFHAGAQQFNTLEDLEFAEHAAPGNLVTLESVYRVAPDNQDLLEELTKGYVGYAFALLEDHIERAELADNDVLAARYRLRARTAYRRGRMYAMQWLDAREPSDGGPEARVHEGLDAWRRYLQRFDDRDDAPALYWAANAWASQVQMSQEDPGALLDVPFAVALAERALALDEGYYYGAAQAFFGAYHAATPRELGGRPDRSRDAFEAALRLSGRRMLMYQVLYARTYAVMVQDRALFERLLHEVLDAGDVLPDERLANVAAKRRAQRYLSQADALFIPPDPSGQPPAAETPADAPATGGAP